MTVEVGKLTFLFSSCNEEAEMSKTSRIIVLVVLLLTFALGLIVGIRIPSRFCIERTVHPSKTVVYDGDLWGTYKTLNQEIVILSKFESISAGMIDSKLKSAIENMFSLNYGSDYGSDVEYAYFEIGGDGNSAVIPFVWTIDNGKVSGRWIVWSMGKEGVLTFPNSDNSEDIVFVDLVKLSLPHGEAVIGPRQGYTVVPFIVLAHDEGWFIKDLPNVFDGDHYIPIRGDILNTLEDFLKN